VAQERSSGGERQPWNRLIRPVTVDLVESNIQILKQMEPLLHLFDFAYPHGYLFLDRTGVLCRRLRDMFPGLEIKNLERAQVDLHKPADGLDLYAGVGRSSIQTVAPAKLDFPPIAAAFLGHIAETLELTHLQDFRIRYVLGRACASEEEANQLMWPLVANETREKLDSISPKVSWRALQGEFVEGNLVFFTRFAIIDMPPISGNLDPTGAASKLVPYITFQTEVKGVMPIAVAELDVQTFIRNVCQRHTENVLAKLAPHLS